MQLNRYIHVLTALKLHAKMYTTTVLGLRNNGFFFPVNVILPLKEKEINEVKMIIKHEGY